MLPALAVALAIVYWSLSLQTLADTVGGFRRFTPPGELAQPFDRGHVHIYAEPDRVEPSAATDRPSLPEVEVLSPDGAPVAQVPYLTLPGTNAEWTYEIAGHRGVGVTSFYADQPGEYRIVATEGDGLVLALGEAIGQEREKSTFNAIGYAFLGFLAGGIVAVLIALMRGR